MPYQGKVVALFGRDQRVRVRLAHIDLPPVDFAAKGIVTHAVLPDGALMPLAARRFLQLPKHRVQVERGHFLARREINECVDLLCHDRLHAV